MAEDNKQPDDLSREEIEALEQELRTRELEDQWFGQPNALAKPEEVDQDGNLKVDLVATQIRDHVAKRVTLKNDPHSPESIIDSLQEQGRLPESIHTSTLVKFLEFLGKRFGLRINVGEFTMFPINVNEITLGTEHLTRFLGRGAIAGSFLGGLLISSSAFAQEFQPGMDLLNDPNFQKVVGTSTEDVWHLEYVAALLLLLGLSSYGVYKIIKWHKKQKPYKEKAKKVAENFEKYEDAIKSGDGDRVAEAQKDLLISTMGELPETMEEVGIDEDAIITQEAVKKALEWKKKVDMTLSDAILEIEKEMVIPKSPTIKNLNAKKDAVYNLLANKIEGLNKLLHDLKTAYESLSGEDQYMKAQLAIEMTKVKYYLKYLEIMKKKWLVLIQNAKNEVISKTSYEKLDTEDKLTHDISKLKEEFSTLLDQQTTQDPSTFSTHLAEIEAALDEKIEEATEYGLPGFDTEEPEVIASHSIKLLDEGKYDHKKPIHYKIDELADKIITLNKDFSVQIWINTNSSIQMNLNFKNNLVETKTLKITEDGHLCIEESGQSIDDYINEKQSDPAILGLDASKAELGPEAEPILNQLAAHVKTVNEQIRENHYKTFGKSVETDDEAIEYHVIKVHREYYQGAPLTVARFTLSEKYWKKALAHLSTQGDIPHNSVYYNYHDAHGQVATANQEMRRFNIVVNGKQAFVLIPTTEKLKALSGEVRVVFDPKIEYTEEEIKAIFAETSKRLGIASHLKVVSAASRKREQERVKAIRKESHDASGDKIRIHGEYEAEGVNPESLETLKGKGLHSLYHQFDLGNLEDIFRAGHLLATATRWSKGILKHGMSSGEDMIRGGGTEAFTRVHTKYSAKNSTWYASVSQKPAIILRPDVFKRMDCYCYTSDLYGSKIPGTFSQRVSPSKLIDSLNSSYHAGNEVMFHDAVSLDEANYIVYEYPQEIIKRLEKMGITKIGGKPLKDAVITSHQFSQLPPL